MLCPELMRENAADRRDSSALGFVLCPELKLTDSYGELDSSALGFVLCPEQSGALPPPAGILAHWDLCSVRNSDARL